jgi:hypothetical protein
MTCELFEVLEVSWPIVLLSEILVGGELKPPQNIDIRKITCLRISDAYVKAVKSFDPLRDVEVKK